jgi:D-arabinose 1-dehydrogenase-like Zn-dependent alcohol dehydrogenase
VRIKVQACGICHSDSLIKDGTYPGIQYPRVPGHEVAGVIDTVGPGVTGWEVGQRVGVGWHGGYCGRCDHCRRGHFFACVTGQVTGISFDGGYGEYMIAPTSAVALMPADLPPVEAAPLLCAGVTTFNALRNSGARPGDVVAILGLGGLGHLAVQYAAKMGFHTVGIARGQDKAALARQLGAAVYIDSQAQDPAAKLQEMGGAAAILATATSGEAMSAVQGGLAVNGTLLIRGGRVDDGISPVVALGMPIRQGLVFRYVDRLPGHADLQRPYRRAADERSLPAGASPRSVRSHDERQGPVPSRADHRALTEVGGWGRKPSALQDENEQDKGLPRHGRSLILERGGCSGGTGSEPFRAGLQQAPDFWHPRLPPVHSVSEISHVEVAVLRGPAGWPVRRDSDVVGARRQG